MQHKYAPSINEIRVYLGVSSTSTVHKHLTAIERRGFLRRKPGLARGLEVVLSPEKGGVDAQVKIPVVESLGLVHAEMDTSNLPKMIVGRGLLPAHFGAVLLYQIPALEIEKPWRSWAVVEYDVPVPYETQVLAGFVMDGKTPQIRWIERRNVVSIFRHRGANSSFQVNESRIVFVGPVIARIQTMEREEILAC